eukprot:20518-Eustigmatos_ZCMA.PRE.1
MPCARLHRSRPSQPQVPHPRVAKWVSAAGQAEIAEGGRRQRREAQGATECKATAHRTARG